MFLGVLFAIFSTFLLILSWIDLKTLRLPDVLTLSLLWLGLSVNAFAYVVAPETAILGAIAGYLSFFFLSRLYAYVRQQEGLGLGDAKLLAAIGAWLGWHALPIIVLNAAIINLIWALSLLLNKKSSSQALLKQHFPFGPALAISAIVAMCVQLLTIK